MRPGSTPRTSPHWDLMVHSVEAPAYLGRDRELLAGPRMDNLLSVHAAVAALASSRAATTSRTSRSWPPSTTRRTAPRPTPARRAPSSATSWSAPSTHAAAPTRTGRGPSAGTVCLSSDTGHAVHPNYGERHDPTHRPRVNGGPILKVNVNQRYATDGGGRALFAAACEKAGVPWQSFVSNNDMPCGTTIGPITAARHGIRTVDIGVAILSMHSARELCGAEDPYLLANALVAFLEG